MSASSIPTPERDPYFNRGRWVDADGPPLQGGVPIGFGSLLVERDYRLRREMRGTERGFRTAGTAGLILALAGQGVCALFTYQTWVFWPGVNAGGGRLRAEGLALLLLTSLGFASCAVVCWGLRRALPWSRTFLTVLTLPPLLMLLAWGPTTESPGPELPGSVAACSFWVLTTLWRPRGRLYFSERYRGVVARVPGETTRVEAGHAFATALLTSIVVVHLANAYLILLWLRAVGLLSGS